MKMSKTGGRGSPVIALSHSFLPSSLEVLDTAESTNYFWNRTKHFLVLQLLQRHLAAPPRTIMDIGCGTGSVLAIFQRKFPSALLTGIDNMPEAIAKCRQAVGNVQLLLHDITVSPPPVRERYDAVTLLDVLEHLEHPHTALRHAHSILSPGGIIIASVPIAPSLYCARDAYVGHYRRFRTDELCSLFKENGFRVIACGAFFSFLFLPSYFLRRVLFPLLRVGGREIEKLEILSVPVLNTLLAWIGMTEAYLAARFSLPLGTSAFCVATPSGTTIRTMRAFFSGPPETVMHSRSRIQ